MSTKQKSRISSICERYPGIRMMNGCPMDQASYQRHLHPQDEASPVSKASLVSHADVFLSSTQSSCIAGKGADRTEIQPQATKTPAVEYHPGTPPSLLPIDYNTNAGSQQFIINKAAFIPQGSGSYHMPSVTSGSYTMTSASFLPCSAASFSSHSPYDSSRNLLGGYGLHLI